ncbi:MAG: type II toxin-antitoxin system HicB family antitoxin [Clostridiales Family XIII bacterium]|jgi:predicted RNase H-like HicB family nuclease|nr:type II toxin-antitoxin system HicB family antitoxin [Clostridiales Family XIII bacterium]
MKMDKVYPAIFHKEEDGTFWVEFPDLPGCLTDGETLEEAIKNAGDVLGVYLATRDEENLDIPASSDIKLIETDDLGFVSYVSADINKYRRNTKAVKKTLSIPQWLSEEAEQRHISLSALLQNALLNELSIN